MTVIASVDTNVMLQAIPKHGIYHELINALIDEKFTLIVSNEILTEYREIIEMRGAAAAWPDILNIFEALKDINVKFVSPTYRWGVIRADRDDNKFVDAAAAGDATHIVTEDTHYVELQASNLLSIAPILPHDFIALVSV